MYKIKQIPEDFIVNEVSNPHYAEGQYGYFILKKRDYATQSACEKIAAFLNIPVKSIGYAGNKDRHAVTTQMISIKQNFRRLEYFKADNIKVEFKGTGKEPISLGNLEGNAFEIIVRNISKKPKKIEHFVNLFDKQRFSKQNAEVGKAIIKKDFKKAVKLLSKGKGKYEQKVKEHYKKTKDAVNSLKRMPIKVLRIYVYSYQSKIWNGTAEQLKRHKENIDIPLVGFGTEIKNKKIKKIIEGILKKERVSYNDFLIRQIPEISPEGTTRTLYADIQDLNIGELEKDELNKGKKKIMITFMLNKGCYATMALKNMFK